MRINVYAEELPEGSMDRCVQHITKTAETGITYHGARLFLKSPAALHDRPDDDDRTAITFWGPRERIAMLLRQLANTIDFVEPAKNVAGALADH
ncbi:MAG: hypothetical protein HY749_16020 [Gammaproteobacteria bacterium]|nr:hypothetical protein [Gammaproteobacteria bacterium]